MKVSIDGGVTFSEVTHGVVVQYDDVELSDVFGNKATGILNLTHTKESINLIMTGPTSINDQSGRVICLKATSVAEVLTTMKYPSIDPMNFVPTESADAFVQLVRGDSTAPEQTLKCQYEPALTELETLVQPEQANISIAVLTDTRQTGTNRLAYLIASLLRREGYVNVKAGDYAFHPEVAYVDEVLMEKQLQVPITVRAGTMSTQPPAIQIDLSDVFPKEGHLHPELFTDNTDGNEHQVEFISWQYAMGLFHTHLVHKLIQRQMTLPAALRLLRNHHFIHNDLIFSILNELVKEYPTKNFVVHPGRAATPEDALRKRT